MRQHRQILFPSPIGLPKSVFQGFNVISIHNIRDKEHHACPDGFKFEDERSGAISRAFLGLYKKPRQRSPILGNSGWAISHLAVHPSGVCKGRQ
jgi:hypothetical protein